MVKLRVLDLIEVLKEVARENCEFVEIEINDSFKYDELDLDSHVFPQSLSITGMDGFGGGIDFDDDRLNHLDIPYDYKL